MEFHELMFELSHKERLNIIDILSKGSQRLSAISRQLEITTAEVSRHLDRLVKADVVLKRTTGNYTLTPFGLDLLMEIENIAFLANKLDYFSAHDISMIPLELQNLKVMQKGRVMTGTLQNMSLMKETVDIAEEFIYVVTNQVSNTLVENQRKKADMGVEIVKVYPMTEVIPDSIIGHKNIRLYKKEGEINCSIGVTEKRCILALPKANGSLDFENILVGEDPEFIEWSKMVVESYVKDADKEVS